MEDESAAFSFKTWPFFWLMRAQGQYLAQMEKELRLIGLDLPRWRVLLSLHEEKRLSVSEMANYSAVKLSTMTRIVQRMQADGLVDLASSSRDARVTEVWLTPTGEQAGELAWQAARRVYTQAFGGVSKARINSFTTMCKDIVARLA